MNTTFITPVKKVFFVLIGLVILLGTVGKLVAGNSILFPTLFLIIAAFAVPASQLRAARQMDINPRTWFISAAWLAVLVAALFAITSLATDIAATLHNPWYVSDSPFIVSAGNIAALDTNGAPYLINDYGFRYNSQLLTLTVYLTCYLMLAAIGIFLGTVSARWNVGIAIALVIATFLVWTLLAVFLGQYLPSIAAPIPGMYVFGIPVTLICFGLAVQIGRKLQA